MRLTLSFHRHLVPTLLLSVLCASSPLSAAINGSGDVSPYPPSTWVSGSTSAFVGNNSTGTVTVDSGSKINTLFAMVGNGPSASGTVNITGLNSTWTNTSILNIGVLGTGNVNILNGGKFITSWADIGVTSTAHGTVTVDGASSSWTSTDAILVGVAGTGTLNITNNSTVTNQRITYVSYMPSGIGRIDFGPNGGTLNTNAIYALPTQVTGTGTINSQGYGGDFEWLLDSSHAMPTTLNWNIAGQNVTVNLNFSGGTGGLGVGYSNLGLLTIRDGQTLKTSCGDLGFKAGATGRVTVEGAGSAWTSTGIINVGYAGRGILNIGTGAQVTSTTITFFGQQEGSSGSLNFGTNGGTLNTASLFIQPSQITGTGVINTKGLCSDIDLVVDAQHGLAQNLLWNTIDQHVALNLDLTSSKGILGAGFASAGTLAIRDGLSLTSSGGYLGYHSAAQGSGNIDGVGTTWSINGNMYVGNYGQGKLSITHGGSVKTIGTFNTINIGYASGASGDVSIDGSNSTLLSNYALYVGYQGHGTLRITRGGTLTASSVVLANNPSCSGNVNIDGVGSSWHSTNLTIGGSGAGKFTISNGGTATISSSVSINKNSALGILVDGGTTFNLGTSNLANNGNIRLLAGPQAAPGSTWTPITAGTWSGTGTITTLGGTYNTTTHIFTASAITSSSSDTATTLDRSLVQRLHITDPAQASNDLYAAFAATTTSTNITFHASLLSAVQTAQLPAGDTLLSAWNFTTSGYTAGDPVLLSFNIGSGYNADQITLWHFDGSAWTTYSADDLNVFGNYANFTVTGFSGYAITAAVPEPSSLTLLILGTASLLGRRRRH